MFLLCMFMYGKQTHWRECHCVHYLLSKCLGVMVGVVWARQRDEIRTKVNRTEGNVAFISCNRRGLSYIAHVTLRVYLRLSTIYTCDDLPYCSLMVNSLLLLSGTFRQWLATTGGIIGVSTTLEGGHHCLSHAEFLLKLTFVCWALTKAV